MRRMTWVRAWVRPMPMWWAAVVADGDGAGVVDAVVADAVVGVGVATRGGGKATTSPSRITCRGATRAGIPAGLGKVPYLVNVLTDPADAYRRSSNLG
jgi:hypothetical protein